MDEQMSILDVKHWRQRPAFTTVTTSMTIDEIFQTMNKHTIWVVHDRHLDEVKGLCAIYGKQPRIHPIGNDNIVYYHVSRDADTFIYPYNPQSILTLKPTIYVAREIIF